MPDDFRVCFAYKTMGIIEDWENPASMIPRSGDYFQTLIDGKLVRFEVVNAIWSQQSYVMIVLDNPRDTFTGKLLNL